MIAVVVSFVGLRFQKFPPRARCWSAASRSSWRSSSPPASSPGETARTRRPTRRGARRSCAENEASGDTIEADEEAGTTPTSNDVDHVDGSDTTTTVDTAAGAELFNSQGCSGCHTLAAAGSTGETGPDLDGALKGKSADFIKTSIVDPRAEVAEGYPPNVMPQNFGDAMSPDQIDSLVAVPGRVDQRQLVSSAHLASRSVAAKRYHVTTFGCQMNEHDSERMKGMLESLGYEQAAERADADLILFNTCSIREAADERFIAHLGQAKRLKREDPERVVGVGGCWAQSVKDEVFERFPFVDVAFGPGQIARLAEFLASDSLTAQAATSSSRTSPATCR